MHWEGPDGYFIYDGDRDITYLSRHFFAERMSKF
jgi:hypothetical protein